MNRALYCLTIAGLLLAGCAEPTAPEPEPVIVEHAEMRTVSLQKMPEKEYLGSFEVTAYCPCDVCCGAWADGMVYTGGLATEGQTIAVDPNVIPLGSVVEIGGHRYIAEDIGGAVKGNHIDIFFCSHGDAVEWGRQNHEVYLIK